MNPIIVIPSRIASTRLPRKALADIGGAPMIVRVVERVQQAGLPLVVATDDLDIKAAVEALGVNVVMTDANCPSGSDRIYQAILTLDPQGTYDVVVNVQGDMPTLDPRIITAALELLKNPAVDIATLAARITDEDEKTDPAVVKVVVSGELQVVSKNSTATQNLQLTTGRALYFSRATIPHGAETLYHHIGIYAYKRESLKRFVSLPPSPLEKAEKLEQLRALEAGMRIDVAVVDTVPLGVDTQEGLEKARKAYT
jgi:3-deoxy-manno-octulosonate cytidylyltransferase (CMP-KDO synthetase)